MNAGERFWGRVERVGDCWEWTGLRRPDGYGRFTVGRRHFKAHRIAWEQVHGPVPAGLCVLHRCDNPPCVRPSHLFLGTRADNVADMMAKGRGRSRDDALRCAAAATSARLAHPETQVRGERVASARLSAEQVAEIRARVAIGENQSALGREFGVGHACINAIAHRRNWRHVA